DEDIAGLGGYLSSTASARLASEEPVLRRLWHRLPWLLVGTAGAMIAAAVVDAFHEQLLRNVLIAFFIPGIVYLADAVGTQTEALIIRGLSVGVSVRRVAVRELITGVVIGALIALVVYPVILVMWGSSAVSLSVALALLLTCAIATLIAMVLPWLLSLFRVDPAFGSGPLATVIQDILSIATYLIITDWIVA
ncbi:MAG: magnesium transporter, partial [Mycobacterium sp.]